MQLLQVTSILAIMASSASAYVNVGGRCSGSGYDCITGQTGIAVCNGATWQLAAKCGSCGGACVWPAGVAAPFCRC
ncbi:C6 transcription factor [Colletotrichum truncatum]|uniref:C6 transcription factor n=1 Tax=Colletotrichum truncatum TaxID=5467 RepID=A0ACC3ZHL2_COLTU|nr:C6 transcription factor [Colletotrichum truncatum]KAF6790503.1 C6 transcription factor [Colletotrichum truncatum]